MNENQKALVRIKRKFRRVLDKLDKFLRMGAHESFGEEAWACEQELSKLVLKELEQAERRGFDLGVGSLRVKGAQI